MKGRPLALDGEKLQKLREWRATPRNRRKHSLAGIATLLGISHTTAMRAAYGMRGYRERV